MLYYIRQRYESFVFVLLVNIPVGRLIFLFIKKLQLTVNGVKIFASSDKEILSCFHTTLNKTVDL